MALLAGGPATGSGISVLQGGCGVAVAARVGGGRIKVVKDFKVVKGLKDFKVVNDFRSPPGWRLSQSAVTRDA